MPSSPCIATAIGAVAVVALLTAEVRRATVAKAVAKTIASLAFVAVAATRGALDATWTATLLIGLVLALAGDVLLLSHRAFLAGLFAFLAGHVAYAVAFGLRGVAPIGALLIAPVLLAALILVGRWLLPHVKGAMRGPVLAYMTVITVMVLAAAATVGHARSWPIAIGAPAFYLSDLAVARDRFVAPGLVNRLWGLPLYYVAQLVLAWSV